MTGLHYQEPGVSLYHADCFEVLAGLDAESVDAVVTDPPYGLEFMGAEWDRFRIDPRSARWSGRSGSAGGFGPSHLDGAPLPSYTKRRTTSLCRACGKRDAFRNPHRCDPHADWVTIPVDEVPVELRAFQNWCEQWARLVARVLKPGGHILAFGGSRTFHRLACGLEDAGLEVRDCLAWLYGSGFPKSVDVSKAIDHELGAERARVRVDLSQVRNPKSVRGGHYYEGGDRPWMERAREAGYHDAIGPEPVTDQARAWLGWGTGLKPAWEPILLARKAVAEQTIAANVLRHGTGAINVGACRLPVAALERRFDQLDLFGQPVPADIEPLGRWPANVLLDAEAAAHLDAQSGMSESRMSTAYAETPNYLNAIYGRGMGGTVSPANQHEDRGGASRFFYSPKADAEDRDGSEHPTIKPLQLCRWLVTLIAPPGGVVVDPFMGSGSIVLAAHELGRTVIACDRVLEYVQDTIRRLRQGVIG